MEKKTLTTQFLSLTFDELSPLQRKLVDRAREATFRSYAPYSRFKVGAAIALSNGEIIAGANQENAAFPSSLCAERTAAYYAHARYPEATFEAIALAARDVNDEWVDVPISPCGACRQALVEYETLAGHGVPVIMAGRDKVYVVESVSSLLPFTFDKF